MDVFYPWKCDRHGWQPPLRDCKHCNAFSKAEWAKIDKLDKEGTQALDEIEAGKSDAPAKEWIAKVSEADWSVRYHIQNSEIYMSVIKAQETWIHNLLASVHADTEEWIGGKPDVSTREKMRKDCLDAMRRDRQILKDNGIDW